MASPGPARPSLTCLLALARTPVLNEYNFGGFLIFHGVRPFIDGRAELYGDKFLAEYAELVRPNRERIVQTLEQRGIQWALLNAASPARTAMEALPGWRLLYADKIAAVYAHAAAQGELFKGD